MISFAGHLGVDATANTTRRLDDRLFVPLSSLQHVVPNSAARACHKPCVAQRAQHQLGILAGRAQMRPGRAVYRVAIRECEHDECVEFPQWRALPLPGASGRRVCE